MYPDNLLWNLLIGSIGNPIPDVDRKEFKKKLDNDQQKSNGNEISQSNDPYIRRDLSSSMFKKLNFNATEMSGIHAVINYLIGDSVKDFSMFGRVTQHVTDQHHAIDYNTFFLPDKGYFEGTTINQDFDVRGGFLNTKKMPYKLGWRKSLGYFLTGSTSIGTLLGGHVWFWKDGISSGSFVKKYTGTSTGPHVHIELQKLSLVGGKESRVKDVEGIKLLWEQSVVPEIDIKAMLSYIVDDTRTSFSSLKLSKQYANGFLFVDETLKRVLKSNVKYARAFSGIVLLVQGTIECLDPCITEADKLRLDKQFGTNDPKSEIMSEYVSFDSCDRTC